MPSYAADPLPRLRSPEELLRTEVASWKNSPYRENGATRRGIGNAQFVRAVYRASFDVDLPESYEQQIHTGKLVAKEGLTPGDLVFFEGKGFGPFHSRSVGIFLGADQFAIAEKDAGVSVARLTGSKWEEMYKTARRIQADPHATAPTFDTASYGSTAELLREVAKAWSGTLYKQGGTTFEGIGNDEFIRNIYEAIYDTELEGTPKQWATMGTGVKRDALQAGDIILYEAVGIGKIVNQRHAGMYIADGEFVHAIKGSAVTISRLNDPRWKNAYVVARRIDPDEIERAAEQRVGINASAQRREGLGEKPTPPEANHSPSMTSSGESPREMSDYEQRLRQATEPWKGTPYKLGGTTKSGVDCSAFVRTLYEDVYGVSLPRTAEEQERLGAKIERRNLVAGDLLFFRTQGMGPFFKSRHVGIYVGHGEFAQASGRLGVHIARLDNYYWSRKYESARRLPKG
jgi:cell wall-associated NlpC family hydrolase